MLRLLSLICAISLIFLYAAELPTEPDWEDLKRKISVSEIFEKDKAVEAIDAISSLKKAPQIYNCFQQISSLSILIDAVLAVNSTCHINESGKIYQKRAFKEARVWKFLGRISNEAVQREAFTALKECLISDRLATARAWNYLVTIEDELVRGRASKAVNEKRLQKRTALAWIFMKLSSRIKKDEVLHSAISAVIEAPEKDALTIMEVRFNLAVIKDAKQRKKATKKVEEANSAEIKLKVSRSWLSKIEESEEI
ncbi:MAG: hypothetical protein ACK4V2_07390 [Pseudomonadota bacterium]|jgi:hypothetical protein|nr:hypothetical protein [Alphaproteobacteria bacterium]